MSLRSILLAWLALLVGCASPKPPEIAIPGPSVTIFDTGYQESGSKGVFFVVTAIDGQPVSNSIGQTRSAGFGSGFALNSRYVERKVAVAPMKLTLVGTHMTGAPIHELAARAAGTFLRVEGVVDFLPREGHEYGVTGELKPGSACVWLADAATTERATEKVCAP